MVIYKYKVMEVNSIAEEVKYNKEIFQNSIVNMSSLSEENGCDKECDTENKNESPIIATFDIPVCKNIGFQTIIPIFMKYGWCLSTNTETEITFHRGNGLNMYIEIFVKSDHIEVTIPLLNSSYQYRTCFKSYFEASEYIEMQLKHVS